tara:strand:- start:682 stop:1245 length:564 start_codon:yes stop_codon:yes gene_type:complete
MTSESPLLQLQEYNTDVWETVMIELVKARMKYVMDDLKNIYSKLDKELYDSWRADPQDCWKTGNIPREYKIKLCGGHIHCGRILIRIIMGHCKKTNRVQLYPITYESKYFVYGFYLQPSKNSFKIELQTPHNVVNVLDVLSRLNNFEFDRTDANATIHDLVKFLYEREEQMENDKHIYCMVQNKIIS